MDRCRFLLTSLAAGLAGPLAAGAQQADRIARVGYLTLNLGAGEPRGREAFLQSLRDLGYVEGRNLVIEYRDAAGKPERFPPSRPT
jgi:putative ABC transport system substrate-binding protein